MFVAYVEVNGLAGTIPSQLVELIALTRLRLGENDLVRLFCSFFLKKIKKMNFYFCSFYSKIIKKNWEC